ncbi:MAG: hypothetical protein JO274_03675 [Gammaproteobacteria bacterium]|nr:hypothetical protein [Gammaproteobacteria bacterium]
MRNLQRFTALAATAVTLAFPTASLADVTIQQQSTFDLSMIKAHITSTESTTADKQRRDSDMHCEGIMSLLCGNMQGGQIIRLDRDVEWTLEPKKKQYRESHFLTPEQRRAAEQHMKETLEKLQQCPAASNAAPAPDTSKCDMSPPSVDVKATDSHATLAGHDARLSQVVMTRSCRNKDTGDTCDFMIGLDSWLTQDQIPGVDEHKAFQTAYLKKLGLDPESELVQKQMRQFLAPYQDSLKQLADKSGDLKGYPLKTTVRIAFGGEHCAAAKGQQGAGAGAGSAVGSAGQAAGDAAANASASAAGTAAGAAAANAAHNNAASSIFGSAANTFGSKLVGGLFNKKKSEAAPAAGGPPAGTTLPPGMVQAAEFTTETTSIATGAIPPSQFEVPADWKLVVPKEQPEKQFSCPQSGG